MQKIHFFLVYSREWASTEKKGLREHGKRGRGGGARGSGGVAGVVGGVFRFNAVRVATNMQPSCLVWVAYFLYRTQYER